MFWKFWLHPFFVLSVFFYMGFAKVYRDIAHEWTNDKWSYNKCFFTVLIFCFCTILNRKTQQSQFGMKIKHA